MPTFGSRTLHVRVVGREPIAEVLSDTGEHGSDQFAVEAGMSPEMSAETIERVDCLVVGDGVGEREIAALFELLESVRPDLPVVVLTSGAYDTRTATAVSNDATDVLPGDIVDEDPELLADRVRSVTPADGTGRRDQFDRAVFENVSDGLVVHDPETGEIRDVNARYCEMTGYDAEELVGETVDIVTEPDYSHAEARDRINRAREDGPQLFEVRNQHRDGHTYPVEVHLSVVEMHGREHVLASVRDITERRRRERQLQSIVDRIDEAIFLAPVDELDSADPAPDFVSSGYEQIWGQPLEGLHETYEEGFFSTLHPDDYDEYRAFIDRHIRAVKQGDADERSSQEYRIERPDGEVRWVRSDFYPTEWLDDQHRVLIVSRDITERKERARRLESFHDATAELTTVDTVDEAAEIAVEAAAEIFDLPATAVYRYDETDGVLEPAAVGPALTQTGADLPVLTSDVETAWTTFVEERMHRSPADADAQLVTPVGEDRLLLPLGGNGILVVWQTDDTVDTDAANILAATVEAALNRLRGERRLESHREELEAHAERARRLEAITELTQQVEAAITTQSSRQGIQDAVCEKLVAVDHFEMAWIAEAEIGTDHLTPRAVAGRDLPTEALTGDGSNRHPVADVWQTGEPRVVETLVSGGRHSDWRQALLKRGMGSLCTVPLAHGGLTHGVLTVVSAEPDAFGDRVVEVLDQLGSSIGYAMTAIERQRALESDDTLELEFQGTNTDLPFARLANECDCRVRHERTVRRQDGSVSVYYTLVGAVPDMAADIASDVLPGSVEVVARDEGETVIERKGSSWFGSAISEHGGVLRRGRATSTGVTLVVEVPQEADTRTIVERIQTTIDGLELTAQRQHHDTEATPREVQSQLEQRLSDRQYEALKTAYAMGYFDWPRESSGEDVADTLGITQPTVNKHIRIGEHKVFDLLFDTESRS